MSSAPYTTSIDPSVIGESQRQPTLEERVAQIQASVAWIENEMRADKEKRRKAAVAHCDALNSGRATKDEARRE